MHAEVGRLIDVNAADYALRPDARLGELEIMSER